jgi:predicted ArsR family transcriptional regulator
VNGAPARGSGDLPQESTRAVLGPRPAEAAALPARLSRPRAEVLRALRDQPTPASLTVLAARTALHANTVREHLNGLVRAGLARRERATTTGRGRPAWLYRATVDVQRKPFPAYEGLTLALAAALTRSSPDPRRDAIAAGDAWGRALAGGRRREAGGRDSTARRQVVDLLADLGFAPQSDAAATVADLTQCPLLDAALHRPDVVCGVHLGLVRGALQEYGADPAGADLRPFSQPGACRLHLTAREEPARDGAGPDGALPRPDLAACDAPEGLRPELGQQGDPGDHQRQ